MILLRQVQHFWRAWLQDKEATLKAMAAKSAAKRAARKAAKKAAQSAARGAKCPSGLQAPPVFAGKQG